jgi:eukaryotic-like serine/threonine-protein kinase
MKPVFRLAALGAAAVAAVSPVGVTAAHAATAPGGQAQAQSAAWPQFHYNAAHTGYNPRETILSPAAVPGLHLLWLASTHGAGTGPGSVSIRSGRAYLGGFSPPALWAWNATTGARRWKATTDDLMESTPAAGGSRVFVESNGGILYAFDGKTGATLWTQSIGGAATSPALVNNVVYAAGYFTMNAFDAATGALLWRTALPGVVTSNPAVASGRVFVATEASRRNLLALNAATGAVLWAKTVGGVQLASPAVRDGVLYQCSATGLFALGVAHGQQHWFQPAGCSLDATPAIANGVIYTAPSQQPLRAFSASSGALLWSGGNADSVFAAAPAVADGVVYAAAGPGTIAAYDVTTHALLWTSPNLGLGESSPAVVNGRLYAADGKGLYAFGL